MGKFKKSRNTKRFLFALFFSLTSLAWGGGHDDGISPFWDWKTLETDHFRITYPAEHQKIAIRAAAFCEESHRVLSKELKWEPSTKTTVILIDNADLANGQTTAALRIGMSLNLTPPDNWFPTYYYDDWLRYLVFHEYTHFLNIDPTRGYAAWLKLLLGDSFRPNSLWTTWMLEGIAVYNETRFTQGGRGRSTLYEMILRTAVHDGVLDTPDFMTFDRLDDFYPHNPFGETPYFFGFHLFQEIALQNQKKTENQLFGELSYRSGGRIPFLPDQNLKNLVGKDWKEIWNDWVLRSQKRMDKQLQEIKKAPLTSFQPIGEPGNVPFGATGSPDGKWLAFTEDHSDRRRGLYLLDLKTPGAKPKRILDKFFGTEMSFTKDSQWIIGSAIRRNKEYYLYSDLFAYHIKRGDHYWISDFLRARDPHLSSQGRRVVFTITEAGRTGLGIGKLSFRKDGSVKLLGIKKLYLPSLYSKVSHPKFSPDGNAIVFSRHRNGQAQEDLMWLDLKSRKLKTLVKNGGFNRFPVFDQNGNLHYISDQTGVDNLYRYTSAGKSQRVTNFVSGAWFPTFHQGKLYASVYTSKGWRFSKVSLPSRSFSKNKLPASTRPKVPSDARSQSNPEAEEKKLSYSIEDYSVFPSIWPRYWMPLVFIRSGGASFGAQVGGFDALDFHRYELFAAYDTRVSLGDWSLSYINRNLGANLGVFAQRGSSSVTTSGGTVTSFFRETDVAFSVSFQFRKTFSTYIPTIAVGLEKDEAFSGASLSSPSATSAWVKTALANLSFSNTQSSRLGISIERGYQLRAGAKAYFNSGETTLKGLTVAQAYYPILSKHIVLTPQFTGALISKRNSFRRANVILSGFTPGIFESSSAGRVLDFDEISLRGYPNTLFTLDSAAVGGMELRIPVWRIFRGLGGTLPLYFENFYLYGYGESAFFPDPVLGKRLAPSFGGGARLSTKIGHSVPVTFSVDFQNGTESLFGGAAQTSFSLLIGG